MFAKFVAIMSIASFLTMMNNRLYDSGFLRLFIYALMAIYVYWIMKFTYKVSPQFYTNKKVVVLFILLIVNILLSPYEPLYPRIIKYMGYLGSFAFGYIVCDRNIKMTCNKTLLLSLFLLPLILVGFFDKTPHKTLFFNLSNTYSFFGLCCVLFVYTIYHDEKNIFKWCLILLMAYVISASTLGIIAAVALAILIIHRRNVKMMTSLVVFCVIATICVMKVDLPVFLRIRDVINIATSLSWSDWTNLKDMNFYEVSLQTDMASDRDDNTSFLWRLAHWQRILDGFFENWWYSIPFGLGDGYAHVKCGNYCHNEFLKFLAENGIFVFGILMSWVKKAHGILQGSQVYYFILAIICYHFTENLIDTFVACVLFYFSLGYWIRRVGNNLK